MRSGVVGRGEEGATFAYFSPDDLGVIAAAAYADSEGWNGKEINLSGDDLTDKELASLLSELSGLDIKYTEPPAQGGDNWRANQNLPYDTDELRKTFPEIMTLRQYLEIKDYGQKLKAMSLLPLPPAPPPRERPGADRPRPNGPPRG